MRTHPMPPDTDEITMLARLAASRVLAVDGYCLRVRDAWGNKPTVHVFLRQFGCLFCHQTVAEMIAITPDVVAAGGHVVMVGCGSVEHALRFARDKRLPRVGVSIYTDPSRTSYEVASLERGYERTFFNPDSLRAYARARADGHRITGVAGDIPQLGGVFVIEPPARLRYAHRSRFAGDHPSGEAVVAALRAAQAA